jgi:succinate dehydrogenase/fumarate reductase flavoprotein subunit
MVSMPDDHFYLILSSLAALAAVAAEKRVDWYHAKGLLQKLNGVAALANWMEVDKEMLVHTLRHYNDDAKRGTDEFTKTLFINGPGGKYDLESEIYYAGRVTPVVHYCMGGIAMNTQGQVLKRDRRPIPGLYAAGEVTGGLHGENGLGGNSLLECAAFGRIIGNGTALANKAKIDDKSMNDDWFSKSNKVTSEAQKKNPTKKITLFSKIKERRQQVDTLKNIGSAPLR